MLTALVRTVAPSRGTRITGALVVLDLTAQLLLALVEGADSRSSRARHYGAISSKR